MGVANGAKYGGMTHEAKYYNGQNNVNVDSFLEYSDKTLNNMRKAAGYHSAQMNRYRIIILN